MTSSAIVPQFYRRLLELDPQHDAPPQIEVALRLLVVATSATAGYFELFGPAHAPQFARAIDLTADQIMSVRAAISRGHIAHALAEKCGSQNCSRDRSRACARRCCRLARSTSC